MTNCNKLRKKVKLLCALQPDIKYAEIAEYLEIKINSFYNFMSGYYDLSLEKQEVLKEVIDNLSYGDEIYE